MKIAYIHGRCERVDACADAMRAEIGWLAGAGHEVRLFARACDADELPVVRVRGEADVAFHPFFQACDLAVFHFDGHDPLFNLLPALPLRARRIVVYHDLAAAGQDAASREQAATSLAQVANIGFAHHVVCAGEAELAFLRGAGITTPASVLAPAPRRDLQAPPAKPSFASGVLRMVCIGSLATPARPLDFLHALGHLLKSEPGLYVQADIVGSPAFDDPAAREALERGIRELDRAHFAWLGLRLADSAGGQARAALLRDADLVVLPAGIDASSPPAADALACGCRAVAGAGAALDAALRAAALKVSAAAWREDGYRATLDAAQRALREVSGPAARARFLDFIHQQGASRP